MYILAYKNEENFGVIGVFTTLEMIAKKITNSQSDN